jgi:nitrogen fixation protein NifU and related proteins
MTDNIKDPFDILEEKVTKEMETIYSQKTIDYAKNPRNLGRMNDPDASAYVKGPCGDSMEIYLIIKERKITEALFYTDGCGVTYACGSAMTEIIKGKPVDDILALSPKDIINHLGGIPEDHIHCSILAVSTLYKALADYLLKK